MSPLDAQGVTNLDQQKPHTASLVQFVLSLLAMLFTWGIAFLLVLAGLLQRLVPSDASVDALPIFLTSAGAFLIGFLLLPSVIYAWKGMSRDASHSAVTMDGYLLPLAAFLLLPLVLWLGSWLVDSEPFAWLLLPPLHILAIGLPILLLVYVGIRKIPVGSPQRFWGLFASGSFLAPVLIFSVEIIGILILIIMGAVWLTTQPEMLRDLRDLAVSMQQAESNPVVIQSMLAPFLTRPGVILAAFTFTTLFVPLVEELLKPIGVWFLAGSVLTPARGFAAGVLCGAGYALFESLGLANSGVLWSGLVIARMGTAAVHIFTTALTGWALAIAWKSNRYLLLGTIYLLNVLVHGIWNAFTLTIVFTELPRVGSNFQRIAQIGEYAPYVLIGLTVLTFTGLLVMNLWLTRHQPGEMAPQTSGIIPPIAKETNGPDI